MAFRPDKSPRFFGAPFVGLLFFARRLKINKIGDQALLFEAVEKGRPNSGTCEGSRFDVFEHQRPFDRSLSTHYAPRVFRRRDGADRRLRVLYSEEAAPAQFLHRGRVRTTPSLSGTVGTLPR